MFGIDSSELLVIALAVVLFVKPKDIPEVMRTIGQTIRKIKEFASEFTTTITKELDEPKKYIKDIHGEIQPTFEIPKIKDEK